VGFGLSFTHISRYNTVAEDMVVAVVVVRAAVAAPASAAAAPASAVAAPASAAAALAPAVEVARHDWAAAVVAAAADHTVFSIIKMYGIGMCVCVIQPVRITQVQRVYILRYTHCPGGTDAPVLHATLYTGAVGGRCLPCTSPHTLPPPYRTSSCAMLLSTPAKSSQ
jgi:hypothetical protein